jgi:hypothetical protein
MNGCNRLGIQSMPSSWLAGHLLLSLLKHSSDYITHIAQNSALFGFLFLHSFETFTA